MGWFILFALEFFRYAIVFDYIRGNLWSLCDDGISVNFSIANYALKKCTLESQGQYDDRIEFKEMKLMEYNTN